MSVNPAEAVLFSHFSRAKIYLLLAIYAGCLCFPLLLGRSLYWGDILLYFLPMADLQRANFLHGQIPLWNPYVLLGQPLLGNPQMGVFYPPNAILFLFPGWLSLSILTVFHLWLCGVFSFHFLRVQKLCELAALVGALAYAGSSAIIARLQFPPMVMVAPYLPLLLLLIDRIAEKQILMPASRETTSNIGGSNRRPLTTDHWLLSFTVALMLLASHPQMAYLSLLVAVPYAVYRVRQQTGKWFGIIWVGLAGSFALGLGLCAVQLLPTLQLLRESPREQMTPEMANRFFLEARQLLTLVFPRVLGHPAFGDYKAAGNAWEPAIFVGWLPVIAACSAIKKQKHLSVTRFWLIVSAVNLWLAFGVKAILFRVAFWIVPGVSKFHDPARFLFPLTFALIVLCAFGVEEWIKSGVRSRGLKVGAILLTALPLLWSAQAWNPTANPTQFAPTDPFEAQQFSDTGRIYLPNYERLWKRFVNYNDYGNDSDRWIKAFRETKMPNVGMLSDAKMVHGYEPVPLLKPLTFVGLLQSLLERGEPQSQQLLQLAAVHELRGEWGSGAPVPGLMLSQKTETNSGGVTRFTVFEPVRWVRAVKRTRRIEGEIRTFATLADSHFNPDETAIVGGDNGEDWDDKIGAVEIGRVTRAQTQWSTEVTLTSEKSFLVFSLVGYPGWIVNVDGTQKKLVPADGAFCGVWVNGVGHHTVTLEYRPTAYRVGLYVTLVSSGILSGLAGFALVARKRAV